MGSVILGNFALCTRGRGSVIPGVPICGTWTYRQWDVVAGLWRFCLPVVLGHRAPVLGIRKAELRDGPKALLSLPHLLSGPLQLHEIDERKEQERERGRKLSKEVA